MLKWHALLRLPSPRLNPSPLLKEVALSSQMRSDGLGITVLITPHTNLPKVATCLPIEFIVNMVTYEISSKFHYLIHTYLFIQ